MKPSPATLLQPLPKEMSELGDLFIFFFPSETLQGVANETKGVCKVKGLFLNLS